MVSATSGQCNATVDTFIMAGKTMVDNQPAAYVCVNQTCREPVTDPAVLGELLEGLKGAQA